MMKGNVCMIDRFIRVVLGLGLLSLPVYFVDKPWAWIGLIGLIPLASGLVGYCPMYAMCRCKTCCCGKEGCIPGKDGKMGCGCDCMKDEKKG